MLIRDLARLLNAIADRDGNHPLTTFDGFIESVSFGLARDGVCSPIEPDTHNEIGLELTTVSERPDQNYINIEGRRLRRHIHYPSLPTDGTLRCISCGQIDEPAYHDDSLCGPHMMEKDSTPGPKNTIILKNKDGVEVERLTRSPTYWTRVGIYESMKIMRRGKFYRSVSHRKGEMTFVEFDIVYLDRSEP